MTLHSQLPAPVRNALIGVERVRPQVPLALYSLAERVENALTENKMIAGMKPRRKKTHQEELFGDSRTNEQRIADNRAAIMSHLTEPRTAKQIADLMGRGQETVATSLRRMKEAGMVDFTEQPRGEDGRPVGRLWHKVQRANVKANIVKGAKTRQSVLALITRPMLTVELAEAFGRHPHHMRQILRDMERAGMIKREGFGPKPEKGAAPVLWIRA
jgi:predicted transcriptional regulator